VQVKEMKVKVLVQQIIKGSENIKVLKRLWLENKDI
jgi:hypothetical protein